MVCKTFHVTDKSLKQESIFILVSFRIPTYDEIVNEDEENFSEEEKQLEKEEKFEQKYNFRFEEPDEEFVSILSLELKMFIRSLKLRSMQVFL